MYNYKLIISYDGSRYLGWQKQLGKEEKTIQGKIEYVLSKLFDSPISLIASGRTDAGVHAKGQTANFHAPTKIELHQLLSYCQNYLPRDIAIMSASFASARFHSRYNVTKKTYCYTIDRGLSPIPFTVKYAYHLSESLDVDAMKKAADSLIGTHDFASFTTLKSKKKSTVRTVHSIDWIEEGPYLKVFFCGNGFLQHMVRILMGTLIEVGLHQRSAEEMPLLLEKKTRSESGFTAPSHGLRLEQVNYD